MSWQANLKNWAGRAYAVFEELEPIAEEMQSYFPNRLVFDQNKTFILEIIISGLPDDIKSVYQVIKDNNNKKRTVSDDVKDKRIQWNTKIRPRINRMIDTLGDLMYGRLVRSREEMEAELEEQRKKQRVEETPSELASIIDDMAIEIKPSGEAMDVDMLRPCPNDYNLADHNDIQRYRDDVEYFIKTYPDRRPPPPIPTIVKPDAELYDLDDTEDLAKFVEECEAWNQSAMEINRDHKAKLPLLDVKGKEINDPNTEEYDKDANGFEEASMGSKKLFDVPSSITEDYAFIDVDEDGNQVKKHVVVEKIPERFLNDHRIAFKGKRSNTFVSIANERDYFATPERASATILPYLIEYHAGQTIWDCTDGYGEMSNVWKDAGFNVVCTDFYTKLLPDQTLDFLTEKPNFHYDVIVCNPPFSKKYDFVERAVRSNKHFIMLLPMDILARKRTAPMLRNGFFKGGIIVPAPRFIPKNTLGEPKFYTESSVTGEKTAKAVSVGDCFWLFGFPHPDAESSTQVSVNSKFNVNRGLMGITPLTDMGSMIESCI